MCFLSFVFYAGNHSGHHSATETNKQRDMTVIQKTTLACSQGRGKLVISPRGFVFAKCPERALLIARRFSELIHWFSACSRGFSTAYPTVFHNILCLIVFKPVNIVSVAQRLGKRFLKKFKATQKHPTNGKGSGVKGCQRNSKQTTTTLRCRTPNPNHARQSTSSADRKSAAAYRFPEAAG